ncbi:MAG: hypothetical protein IPG45_22290 [Deltaproteobacteria bacterium]|nr:hypothetical protein [Deltaproteobacteria bacterium]
MWRGLGFGLVGLVLGPACVVPVPVTLDGLETHPDEIYVVIDASRDGRRVLRLEEGADLYWASPKEVPVRLELWAYDCPGRLPDGPDWAPPPDCLPPPKRRHLYDPDAQRWETLDEGANLLVEVCSNCELSRLQQAGFEFPRPNPYLASAVLIASAQLLVVVGGDAAPPAYYLIKGDRVRALTLEGLSGEPPPQLGAMVKRTDGTLFGMGTSLWRLRLEPEADPTSLHFEPWMPGLPQFDELSEGRGAAAEISADSMILVGAHGGVFELTRRGLQRLKAARALTGGLGNHPVDLLPLGPRRLFVVGVGEGKMPRPSTEQIEMADYGLITSDAVTDTSTVTLVPFPQLPRAATVVDGRVYVSDQTGTFWVVGPDGPELLVPNIIDNGPIGTLGDRILASGSVTLIQQIDLDPFEVCEAEPVAPAERIISGESSAYVLSGRGGIWLRPTSLCEETP